MLFCRIEDVFSDDVFSDDVFSQHELQDVSDKRWQAKPYFVITPYLKCEKLSVGTAALKHWKEMHHVLERNAPCIVISKAIVTRK